MTEAVETERLRGEPITAAHRDELGALLGDARVGATLGGVLSPAGVAASIERQRAHWEQHGFGFWLWRERATAAAVARGGLQHTSVDGRDEVEVGWAVMPDRWGEGFATELGAASVRTGFDRLVHPTTPRAGSSPTSVRATGSGPWRAAARAPSHRRAPP